MKFFANLKQLRSKLPVSSRWMHPASLEAPP